MKYLKDIRNEDLLWILKVVQSESYPKDISGKTEEDVRNVLVSRLNIDCGNSYESWRDHMLSTGVISPQQSKILDDLKPYYNSDPYIMSERVKKLADRALEQLKSK